ncbi:MAG: carbonic anhydrase, partial [Actinobacteria bacterium]|nr:carbonic anhydrase [Actinomycetota bacterium]
MDSFRDVVDGNTAYSSAFPNAELSAIPRKHLAVVTCMDCR